MISIVSSYPGFHTLPRGVKQMLITSESNFFEEARPELAKMGLNSDASRRLANKRLAGFEKRVPSGFCDAWRN